MKFVHRMILLLVVAGNCLAQPLTWQDLSGGSGYQVIQQPATGTLLATNRRGVVYRSTDGGISFSSILAYPSATSILELAANGDHAVTRISDPNVSAHYQILRWNGAPNEWTRILATSFSYFQDLTINDSGIVFGIDPFGTHTIVRFGGAGWSSLGSAQSFLTSPFFNRDLNAVTAVDHANNLLVGSGAGGIYISTNYGQTWGRSLPAYPVGTINVSLPGTILVGTTPSPSPPLNTFGGIFASTDTGRTWKGLGLSNHVITALAAGSAGTLYALADGGAYKRVDSSGAWQFISPPNRQFTAIALTGGGSVLLSSEAEGTFRSTNNGVTWTGSDIRGRDVFAIATRPSGEAFAGTLGSGVYKSSPGAEGWTQLPLESTGEYVYSFAASGEALFTGSNRGVSRTTDGGESWLNLSTFGGSAYTVATTPDGSVFAGTGFGVFRSSDNGDSWIQSGLSGSKVFFLSTSSDGRLYAGTATDGVYASTDGGRSWASRGLVRNDLQTIVVNGAGRLFAGVYGGIFRSTDDGSTWQNIRFGDGYVYSIAPAGSQTLLAGTHSGVYVTSNGGDTWSTAGDSGLSQTFVLSLSLDAQNRVLAGTYRGTVYRTLRGVVLPVVNGVVAGAPVPRTTELSQNYPNPFNPRTEFRFTIAGGLAAAAPGGAFVNLRVFDLTGREIAVLVNERKAPGIYTVSWDAGDRPSGVYFYQLRVAGAAPASGEVFLAAKKMVLVR